MDWIRANKSLATILGVAIAGAVGLAVYLFLAYSTYSESSDSLQALAKKVEGMEKAKLYPNEDNLDEKSETVSAFDEEVGKLATVLLSLQQDVTNKPITDTDLQAKIKQRVSEVREKSKGAVAKDFAFGFQDYLVSLPNAEAVADLNDYFDGVDAITTAALEAGMKIDGLSRSNLVVEKNAGIKKKKTSAPAPKPAAAPKPVKGKKGKTTKVVPPAPPLAQMTERRIVTLDVTTDQVPLQTLVNTLASASAMKHFTVLRLLRVENEKIEGPVNKALPKPEAAFKDEPATPGVKLSLEPDPADPTAKPGAPAPAKLEAVTAAKPASPDAFKVMGGEMLKAHLEIDIVRFLDPDTEN